MRAVLTFFLLLAVAHAQYTLTSSGGVFSVTWKLSSDNKTISFAIIAKTLGWVGMGINSSPSMTNADMVIGWVSNGKLNIYDGYATDYIQPKTDVSLGGKSNIINATGVEMSDGTTRISFSRPVNSTDKYDVALKNSNQYIIWAVYTSDCTGDSTNPVCSQHTSQGSFQKNLLYVVPPPAPTVKVVPTSGTVTATHTVAVTTSGDTSIGDTSGNGDGYTNGASNVTTGGIEPEGSSLVTADRFQMTWQVDNTSGIIHLKMSAPTTGWIAIGFNDQDSMVGADMVIGWVYDSKKRQSTTFIGDSYSKANVMPSLDTNGGGTDDVLLTSSTQDGSTTTITFRRKLNTNDSLDYVITDKSIYVLYAYGDSDGTFDGTYTVYNKHIVSGSRLVNFFSGSVETVPTRLRPGVILVIAICGLLVLYTVIRWTYIAIAHRRHYSYSDPVVAPRDPVSSKVGAFFYRRFPFTEVVILHALIFVAYIGVNIATLFVDPAVVPKSFGTLIAANAFLVILPATRNSLLVVLTGIPFDKAIQFHRWLGRFTVAIASVHAIYTFVDWRNSGLSKNIFGLVAWICLLVIFVSSFEPLRRRFFEVFYTIHFSFLAFFVLACLHNSKFIPFGISAAILWGMDRMIRMIYGFAFQRVSTTTIKDEQEGLVQFKFKKNAIARGLGVYSTGQYVFVNFPSVSLFQWHPFSLTSSSDSVDGEIHVRSLGGFTQDLVAAARSNPKMMIRVDGPYGYLNANLRRYPVIILFAGGIGITPVISILRDLFESSKSDASVVKAVYVFWSVKSEKHYQWFSEEISAIQSAASGVDLSLNIFVTQINGGCTAPFVNGRLDSTRVNNILNDVTAKYPLTARYVFACGPIGMVNTVWDKTREKNANGENFEFHRETFEL
ncbi:ferric reductase-like transmembrane protein [Planoprotostelium fungivorum]|uniref:Ferric reductase-like transmembrane protein n=1 Tax=Planoprotostelium fungivorum TaxID=1890364 RepID=A0A2P6NBT1_9EUKA|nr:ferric reductase-like transmembrane protein [Planoprotostelium fungivorum]